MRLLATRFYIPPASVELIDRPRLRQRFQAALEKPLTLLAAPAGSGKTTLAAGWVRALRDAPAGPAVAWLSLDRGDSSPARFWTYTAAALQRALSPTGAAAQEMDDVLALLQTNQPAELEPVVDALINAVDACQRRCVLVIDDYHLIDSRPVHESLGYFVEHQPPLLHLVVATRTDPPLPIHRLRARGWLNELRAADLRFSPEESGEMLRRISGVDLSPEDAADLERATEGWAAGLQMAALALQAQLAALPGPDQTQESIQRWIAGFSGQQATILDYLAEEVLNHQPPEVQDFLMRTSILDEMCADLCQRVILGEPAVDCRATITYLDRAHRFLVPLADRRDWYRYHHLFADLLRVRLLQHPREWIADLHVRASAWFEENDRPADAVRHAFEAQDWPRAARLVEENWRAPVEQGEIALARSWLASLPEEIVLSRPYLAFAACWIYWLTGEISRIEPALSAVDRALAGATPERKPALIWLWRQTPVFRAIVLRHAGDFPGAVASAREGVERASMPPEYANEDRDLQLGVAYYHLAESHRFARELAQAGAAFEQSLPYLLSRSPLAYGAACLHLCRIQQAQGRLRKARETAQTALDWVGAQRLPPYASIHLAAAEVLCEVNDLAGAARRFDAALRLAKGMHGTLRQSTAVALRLARARGAPEEAAQMLQEAERIIRKQGTTFLFGEVLPLQARMWIDVGETARAAEWAALAGFPVPPGEIDTHLPVEQAGYARLLCAQGRAVDALVLLDRCLAEAERGGLWGQALEALLLRAVARRQRGDLNGALGDAERALALGEPEGYLRLFVEEGRPLAALLSQLQKRFEPEKSTGYSAAYLARVLAAFPAGTESPGVAPVPGEPAAPPPLPDTPLEPLTARELEVLRLLALGLSNREMAEKLVLAEGTVKTHVHNLIAKLGAQSRTHAIALGRQMGLI